MRSMAQDPICGRRVDESTRYTSEYKGIRYFFCSACCKEIFDAVPDEVGASPLSSGNEGKTRDREAAVPRSGRR